MIEQFCDWLSNTSLSVAFQNANWFVPAVQTVHIMSIAILLMAVYSISIRLIGITQGSQPLASLIKRSMPWIWTTLGVLLLSGALLTITEPSRELLNWVFRAKMIMVLLLAILLLAVQMLLSRNPQYWTESLGRRHAARALGIAAVLIGAVIVTAGRWIAYV